jgi:hypothetical protein
VLTEPQPRRPPGRARALERPVSLAVPVSPALPYTQVSRDSGRRFRARAGPMRPGSNFRSRQLRRRREPDIHGSPYRYFSGWPVPDDICLIRRHRIISCRWLAASPAAAGGTTNS